MTTETTIMQGSIEIHASRTGWIITTTGYSDYYDALIQGATAGHKVLLPYEAAPDMRGRDYDEPINDCGTTVGEYLAEIAINSDGALTRVIRRGHKVQ